MEHQDWTTVVLKKRSTMKDAKLSGNTETQVRDTNRGEMSRLAKLEQDDVAIPKKRLHPESIQSLIRKRLELGLTQDKADQKCAFPRYTFREIESHRLLPNASQHSVIQRQFGIQLKHVVV